MRIAFLALLITLGCGPTARQVEINAMHAGLNAASDGFVIFSHTRAEEIIKRCDPKVTSEAECKAKVDAYRIKEAAVMAALTIAYTALSSAIVLKDKPTFDAATAAVGMAQKAYEALKEVQ